MARLLQCLTCNTTERMGDFKGHPDSDEELAYFLRPHRHGDGTPHMGNLVTEVPDAALDNMAAREDLLKQMWGARYEVSSYKDTLVEDALGCYSRHSRPKLGCIDYQDSSKKVRGYMNGAPPVYLCSFCPVSSTLTSQVMEKRLWLNTKGRGRRLARR